MEKKSKIEAMAEKEDAPEEKKAVNVDEKGKQRYDVVDSDDSSSESEDELADVSSIRLTF